MRTAACLECLAGVRERIDKPIVPMTYASLLEAYGYERFVDDALAAGAASLIVADLPVESHPELRRIQLVAPTSTDERLRLAAELTDGWLYLVSVTGTTGARDALSAEAQDLVERARASRTVPSTSIRHLDSWSSSRRSDGGRRGRRLASGRDSGGGPEALFE